VARCCSFVARKESHCHSYISVTTLRTATVPSVLPPCALLQFYQCYHLAHCYSSISVTTLRTATVPSVLPPCALLQSHQCYHLAHYISISVTNLCIITFPTVSPPCALLQSRQCYQISFRRDELNYSLNNSSLCVPFMQVVLQAVR
jgi:hypothetical protein